jgi:branched-chain amino acid transport system permease protein
MRRLLSGGGLFLVGALFCAFTSDPTLLDLFIMIGYFLLLTASWNMLAGFTGQFSFAHAALATAGAYASIAFTDVWNVPVLATLPLAGIATGLAGALLGFLCLRVRGVYLSLATFAFSGAFLVWAAAADEITGGTRGHTSQIFFLGASLQPYAWLALGLVTAYFLSQALLLDRGWGLRAAAIRDREEIAYGLGVPTARTKVQAFGFAAFWAGVAGSLLAGYVCVVDPSIGAFENMGIIVAMAVVGGLGRRFGPIVGTVLLQCIAHNVERFGAEYTLLVFSVAVLLVMAVARDGLLPRGEAITKRLWQSRRHHMTLSGATKAKEEGVTAK